MKIIKMKIVLGDAIVFNVINDLCFKHNMTIIKTKHSFFDLDTYIYYLEILNIESLKIFFDEINEFLLNYDKNNKHQKCYIQILLMKERK